MALRIVLLVDEATDAAQAHTIAEALAEAIPEAAGDPAARLHLALFALKLPAALDEQQGQQLVDLTSSLTGPTDQRGLWGAIIAPTTVAEVLGPLLSAHQGRAVALFGYEPTQLEDDQTFIQGARILLQALSRAVEVVVTVQDKARPPGGIRPESPEVTVAPVMPLGVFHKPVMDFRRQIQAAIDSARIATKA